MLGGTECPYWKHSKTEEQSVITSRKKWKRKKSKRLVRDERLYQFLGAPENKKVIGTLFIGYPEADVPPTDRMPAEEKTTWL